MDGLPCIVTHVSGREHEQCPQSGPAQGTSTTRHESSQAVKGNRVSGMPLALPPRMTNPSVPCNRQRGRTTSQYPAYFVVRRGPSSVNGARGFREAQQRGDPHFL